MDPRIEKITKVLLWFVVLALLGGGGFWGYAFLFKKSTTTQNGEPSGGFFGESTSQNPQGTSNDPGAGASQGAAQLDLFKLYQVHDKPIISAQTFIQNGIPFVRFMEQGSGNIFEANLISGTKDRISNTSIPRVGKAVWSRDATYVAFSYLENKEIKTAIGTFSASTTGAFSSITFLEKNIRDLVFSPNGARIGYNLHIDGLSRVRTVQPDGSSRQDVGTLPLLGVSLFWPQTDLMVSTNPSSFGGALYRNSAGSFQRIYDTDMPYFGSIPLSNGAWIVTGSNGVVYRSGNDQKNIASRGIGVKCSVITEQTFVCGLPRIALDSNEVERWLAGDVVSSDDLYLFDTRLGATLLADSETMGDRVFDTENLSAAVGDSTGYVTFKNKGDETLWAIGFPSMLVETTAENTSE